MSSPYHILGVPEGAPIEDCKKAYRILSKKYHPDVGGDTNMFAMVTNAWTTIRDGQAVSPMHRCGVTHNTIFSFREAN